MQHLANFRILFSAKRFTWTLHLFSIKKNQNSENSSPDAKVTQPVVEGSSSQTSLVDSRSHILEHHTAFRGLGILAFMKALPSPAIWKWLLW